MTEQPSSVKVPRPFRKGSLVRVNAEAYKNSVESLASDTSLPDYIFEGPGELLLVQGDYAQVRWRRPVPDIWFRLDQLETWTA
ncbi:MULTISPECIES: NAD(P)H-quinone oxidoreductase subunit O [unclassified Prochlorococcus]|uniref:NAD(P)H-quinone oxidoreductase subunit O n=1 Tax=unclassified Prochlorococcus TaxID=2627481 RepID=UPI0005338DB6|nr:MULTISPECIES: NAD(P)H-quinone oxidoreductase subunit O [unclassified Prochlorococcus]KGG16816.1 hypothetical protein EV06_0659 [Prochlorococcus sp. MIT 0602]KGG18210.1 hypothetical protein EV07_0125 [Prochlorococcus sp. MIT 0603]